MCVCVYAFGVLAHLVCFLFSFRTRAHFSTCRVFFPAPVTANSVFSSGPVVNRIHQLILQRSTTAKYPSERFLRRFQAILAFFIFVKMFQKSFNYSLWSVQKFYQQEMIIPHKEDKNHTTVSPCLKISIDCRNLRILTDNIGKNKGYINIYIKIMQVVTNYLCLK